jgi:hypothetical protein
MSETKAASVARRIAEVRASVGQPGECWCIGYCENGKYPERCPAYGQEKLSFNELMAPLIQIAESLGDVERASAYRAALDPE